MTNVRITNLLGEVREAKLELVKVAATLVASQPGAFPAIPGRAAETLVQHVAQVVWELQTQLQL